MVIDYYKSINRPLSFMELSEKTAMLLLLVTGKHPSEIRKLDLSKMTKTHNKFTFLLDTTKTSCWNHFEDVTVEIEWMKKTAARQYQKVLSLHYS